MSDRATPLPSISGLAFWAAFAAVAAVLYVVAMELNWAVFTYHPRLGTFALGVEAPRSGPAMYWYGWLTTAAGGGVVAGAAASVAARARSDRTASALALWLGWLVPAGAMATALYFMIPFFLVD
jgi:hypothetical protein